MTFVVEVLESLNFDFNRFFDKFILEDGRVFSITHGKYLDSEYPMSLKIAELTLDGVKEYLEDILGLGKTDPIDLSIKRTDDLFGGIFKVKVLYATEKTTKELIDV